MTLLQDSTSSQTPTPRPEFRHVDLAEPESLAAALIDVDVVVNTVPDLELTAERMVLYSGGSSSTSPPCRGGRGRNCAGKPTMRAVMPRGLPRGCSGPSRGRSVTTGPTMAGRLA